MPDSILQFNGEWRSYQKRILDDLDFHLRDDKLHVVAAPGAGKTMCVSMEANSWFSSPIPGRTWTSISNAGTRSSMSGRLNTMVRLWAAGA